MTRDLKQGRAGQGVDEWLHVPQSSRDESLAFSQGESLSECLVGILIEKSSVQRYSSFESEGKEKERNRGEGRGGRGG